MASTNQFDKVPPFPSNVATADISTISLAGLRVGKTFDVNTLVHAAQTAGFFNLSLYDDEMGALVMQDVDLLFQATYEIMNLPEDIKKEFENKPQEGLLGFKPRGNAKTERGQPDRFEWFNLAVDGLSGVTPLQPLPEAIESRQTLFDSFARHGRNVVNIICETLARQLGLRPDAFTSLAPSDKPSGSVVRLLKAFASHSDDELRTAMHHHTDFGTVTLLVNVIGGLQILRREQSPGNPDAWLWVKPQPGCLIVNLGDAMVQWTGGLLHSNIHRIYHAPGEQRFVDRYSLALLVRPERNASMRKLLGSESSAEEVEAGNLTAWEWEVKRTLAFLRKVDNTDEAISR